MRPASEEPASASGGVPGPPWILGDRGSPRLAPENTLAGLARALDDGCDGFAYRLRTCASGELVLMHDATLERTTDGRGPLAEKDLSQLFPLDAGGWFGRRYVGEPIPLFDEVLEYASERAGASPLHWLRTEEPGLASRVRRRLDGWGTRFAVRLASSSREVCREARDNELPTLYITHAPTADDLAFVRDERLGACATGPRGWFGELGRRDWPCERWAARVDEPQDLFDACRRELFAFTTREPHRALATRSLVKLARPDHERYPVEAPLLHVTPGERRGGGDWSGSWSLAARVANPFPFDVSVGCQLFVRLGAFEVEGLPTRLALAPGEECEVPFRLTGGAWSPGGDPLFAVLYRWRAGPGRAAGRLLLDAPLTRVRTAVADSISRRLPLLRESPGQADASMTLVRRGRELSVRVENPGGLVDPETCVLLDGRILRGGSGLRVHLPADFDERPEGLPFACGFTGRSEGPGGAELVLRRFCGGLPDEPGAGRPGRLLPASAG